MHNGRYPIVLRFWTENNGEPVELPLTEYCACKKGMGFNQADILCDKCKGQGIVITDHGEKILFFIKEQGAIP
jgi:hypothetical protein